MRIKLNNLIKRMNFAKKGNPCSIPGNYITRSNKFTNVRLSDGLRYDAVREIPEYNYIWSNTVVTSFRGIAIVHTSLII